MQRTDKKVETTFFKGTQGKSVEGWKTIMKIVTKASHSATVDAQKACLLISHLTGEAKEFTSNKAESELMEKEEVLRLLSRSLEDGGGKKKRYNFALR